MNNKNTLGEPTDDEALRAQNKKIFQDFIGNDWHPAIEHAVDKLLSMKNVAVKMEPSKEDPRLTTLSFESDSKPLESYGSEPRATRIGFDVMKNENNYEIYLEFITSGQNDQTAADNRSLMNPSEGRANLVALKNGFAEAGIPARFTGRAYSMGRLRQDQLKVNVFAAWGGYTWAQMGAAFSNEQALEDTREKFQEFMTKTGVALHDEEMKAFKTPRDFLDFDDGRTYLIEHNRSRGEKFHLTPTQAKAGFLDPETKQHPLDQHECKPVMEPNAQGVLKPRFYSQRRLATAGEAFLYQHAYDVEMPNDFSESRRASRGNDDVKAVMARVQKDLGTTRAQSSGNTTAQILKEKREGRG